MSNFRNRSVSAHQFAMVPRAEIPRSKFKREWAYKTMFNSGKLIPIVVEEVLPGDSVSLRLTALARMQTPVVPVMDNLHLDTFFFFVPNRLVWVNWQKFCGEQLNPGDSTSFVVPQCNPGSGYNIGSVQDYMGLMTVGQYTGSTWGHSNLPLRAYNLIWNQWFRDENLQTSATVDTGDGPDSPANYVLLNRGKRHDYFTSCLPFVQKGTAVPIGTQAPVKGIGWALPLAGNPVAVSNVWESGASATRNYAAGTLGAAWASDIRMEATTTALATAKPTIYADLSAVTVNALRLSVQTQRLLERDARGGTRYTEILLAHFGVRTPDFRLQRPEYLGGGSQVIAVSPVAQTSATAVTGSTTALGNLGAVAAGVVRGHGFSQSFVEHGWIIGLMSVRADLTYQQGLQRKWTRATRFDFYWPAFANLGEQPVYNREIFMDGSANDALVFGYQERWAEYRYGMSQITGQMRSTAASTLDVWHLAQKFATVPSLNSTFIQDSPPISRVVAVTSQPEFFFDAVIDSTWARPMPMYSVPGLMDHF